MASEIANPNLLRFIRNLLPVHMVCSYMFHQQSLTNVSCRYQETWKAEAALEKIVQTLAATVREMRAHQLQQQQRASVQPGKPRGSTSSEPSSGKANDKTGENADDPTASVKVRSNSNGSSNSHTHSHSHSHSILGRTHGGRRERLTEIVEAIYFLLRDCSVSAKHCGRLCFPKTVRCLILFLS